MKILIIALAVLIIVYAVLTLVRSIINMSKGKCCEGCEHCPSNEICSSNPDNNQDGIKEEEKK